MSIKKSKLLAVTTLGMGNAVAAGVEKAAASISSTRQSEAAATEPASSTEPLMTVKSRESGRNSDLVVYADRIERRKERSRLSMSSAAQETETTPMKAVSSVQIVKDGFSSKVILHATGNPIEVRCDHKTAQALRDTITNLLLAPPAPAAPAAAPVAAASVADELAKLASLRDSGVLSDDEFAAEKAKLLGGA